MKKVYFKKIDSYSKTAEINSAAKQLLTKVITEDNIILEDKVPLKVHFGEEGNTTYLSSENYDSIIEYLKENGKESCFIETNAIYSGWRMKKESHIKLAEKHGFTRLPVEIADGEVGNDYIEVEINKEYFKTCKIGKKITEYSQLIIVSHFKGHGLSGFGGAIKQLAMGCAARGGKLAQHVNSKPFIIPFKCKKCNSCIKKCPSDAIETGFIYKINKSKCLGCASCIAICPNTSILINPFKINLFKRFRRKLAEYAYAAQLGKNNIYITFAFNLTKGCDCMPNKMKPIAKDLGIFASTDPVAIDLAAMDVLDENESKKVFGGRDIFDYAESIGLGSVKYDLITLQ
ncbi:DUF362 domain-containing protein [Elusimicrobiota bacterium]